MEKFTEGELLQGERKRDRKRDRGRDRDRDSNSDSNRQREIEKSESSKYQMFDIKKKSSQKLNLNPQPSQPTPHGS